MTDGERWWVWLTGLLIAAFTVASAIAKPAYQADDVRLEGSLTQGGMLIGQVTMPAKVWLDKEPVLVTDEGTFVIGFGRKAQPSATLTVTADGQTNRHTLRIAQRQYAEQRIDNLDSKKVTPPPETYDRIAKEARMARTARANISDLMDFSAGFIWPVHGIITGVYGVRRILNGQERSPHYGIDIAAPTGTPVRMPAGGTIRMVHDMYFSGVTMIIDHGYGVSSTMLHLDKVHAKVGDYLKQGEVLGTVGATGRVTGPHLDWRINWMTERLDPALLVGEMPKP